MKEIMTALRVRGGAVLPLALFAGLLCGIGRRPLPGLRALAASGASAMIRPASAATAARTFDAAAGARLFSANCAVCHQESGEGIPGVFPPLKGNVAVLAADPALQIRVVLNGLSGANVGGVVYSSQMPPFKSSLSDTQIADIIDHERSSWGNHSPLVTAAQVAAVRAKDKN